MSPGGPFDFGFGVPEREPWIPDPATLVAVIREQAPRIVTAGQAANLFWVGDGLALLGAAAENESAFDRADGPRFEASYYYGSRKYAADAALRAAIAKQGALAACSWGPFQLMAMNALRLGYSIDRPLYALWRPRVSAPYVTALIIEILTKQRPPAPADFADAYNSGNWRDSVSAPVQKYRDDFVRHFQDVVQRREL